jgi:hypothetical protein
MVLAGSKRIFQNAPLKKSYPDEVLETKSYADVVFANPHSVPRRSLGWRR